MQEKKKIDADMEKYKTEMMMLYNRKHSAAVPGSRRETHEKAEERAAEKEKVTAAAEKVKDRNDGCESKAEKIMKTHTAEKCEDEGCSEKTEKHEEKAAKDPEEKSGECCKFPSAEELIKMDSDCGSCGGEEAVPAMMEIKQEKTPPDTKFDSVHMQGNYEQCAADTECAEKEEFPCDECGEGCIQVEVTDCEDGSPIAGAAVAVLRNHGGCDVLEVMLTTDSKGETEAYPLEVRASENGKRPYEEYLITVYKEGYYSVNMLAVPVFDTIRSIQPVEMSMAQGKRI